MISPLTALLGVAVLLFILSQFGGKLAARSASVWWFVLGLFMLSAVKPQVFRPIASLLGIELISNFVLTSMIVFFAYQMLEQLSIQTQQTRDHRKLVSMLAVEDFLKKNPSSFGFETSTTLKVLVILPCYNEEESLSKVIEQLNELESTNEIRLDFCIVDDGSLDRSRDILAKYAPQNFAYHLSNIGVAGVLMTGFQIGCRLNVDYIVQCDSDGQHPIPFISEFVLLAAEKKADLMVGSRFAGSGEDSGSRSTTVLRRLGSLLILGVLHLFGTKAYITDPTSGFRVYSRKLFEFAVHQMPDEYPEPELLAIAATIGGKVEETPVTMSPREKGVSSISGLGTIRYMLKTITALLGLRLRSFGSKKVF